MKIALCGMFQAGQQALFSLLTGIDLETIRQKPLEAQVGACDVIDPRITKLKQMYNPKKTTYTKIEYLLLPDFSNQPPLGTLKNMDEIGWITRGEDAKESIPSFISELALADFMLVEKRLETIAKEARSKGSELREKEKVLMEICKAQLEKELPLSSLTFTEEQKKNLKAYQFFTLKPIFIVINVAEDKLKDKSLLEEIKQKFPYPCIQLSVEIEQEIGQLAENERLEFMKELGIDEPAIDKMNCIAYEGLGLISFFTVGEDEVRAWPVHKGALAPEAGAVIHTDIAKGFVRTEMFKYTDLISAGSESKLKETGKFNLKGKDYIVEDGDILSFRFNV